MGRWPVVARSDVGHGIQPVPYFFPGLIKAYDLSRGPTVGTDKFDGILYLAFFVGCPDGTRMGPYAEDVEKFKKGFIETDDRAHPLRDCGEHIVDHDFLGNASKVVEGFQ
nr:hypothetical protein [uncultured Desulfobulbus sp.]